MHSWRLLYRCAAVCFVMALVMSGLILNRAGDNDPVVASDQATPERSTPQVTPEPAPELAPDEEQEPESGTSEKPAPTVKVVRTEVPEVKPDASESDLVAALPATDTDAFKMVGVTWADSRDDVTVKVRTRTNGTWGSWEELEVDEHADEGRPGTEPLWVGQADGVAARVTAASGVKPADLRIETIDPGEDTSASTATPAMFVTNTNGSVDAQPAADPEPPEYTAQPSIVMRSTWGALAGTPCDSPITGPSTLGVVVHHTAGSNSYSASQSASIVRATQAYHVKSRNWCDIGYNFLVDKYGQIFEGRRGGIYNTVRAAHSGNGAVNTSTMGISMMGEFSNTTVPEATKAALTRLIGWRMGTTYMKAKGTYPIGGINLNRIAGHRNVVGTACPGQKAYDWLISTGSAGLRQRVETYISKYSSEIKTYALKLGPSVTGVVSRGEYPTNNGRRTIFSKMDMYSTASTGAHNVAGEFLTEYRRIGFHKSRLAFPTSNPSSTADSKVAVQRFMKGSMFRIVQSNGTRKAFALWDSVATTYKSFGEYAGKLGYPTSSVATSSNGNLKATFTKGSIVYDAATKVTTAYDLNGAKMTTSSTSPAPTSSINQLVVPSTRKFTLDGHGYGHGIGMSQYGAQGAAIAGRTYDYILGYYYKGTTLGSRSGNIRILLTKDTSPDVIVKMRARLQFRNVATGAVKVLPATVGGVAVAQWRITPVTATPTVSTLQYKTSTSGWRSYKTHWTGDGQFEAPGTSMAVVMPGGSAPVYRNIVRSAVPKVGSSDRQTVNILSLEHYVRGVISAEMPSSWKPEALKAQAVAARTYGVRGLVPSRYYDLCDTTSCQVYRGVSAEVSSTNAAVSATAHKIVMYDGKPAFTQFSSSSGGRTAKGSQPYLGDNVDYFDNFSGNPVHSWRITVAASTVEKKWPTIGTLKSITITKRAGNTGYWHGRVLTATLTGSKGTKAVTGDELRFALGLRSNWFAFD